MMQSVGKGGMVTFELVNQQLKDMEKLRKEQDNVIRKINDIHSKLSTTAPETAERFAEKQWVKLRGFYVEAKNLADAEETLVGISIGYLDTLVAPGQPAPHRRKPDSSVDHKRKRIKTEINMPRIASPALPRTPPSHANIAVGDQVAARVSPDDADQHEWIVVKVTRFDRDASKYEVIDEEPDDDGESGQRVYKLGGTCVIPFTKRTDAGNAPDFPPGSHVLAVYPGTTALYKASVVPSHRKRRVDDYLLEFDGDEEEGVDGLPKRPVPFHHVVQLPEGHRP